MKYIVKLIRRLLGLEESHAFEFPPLPQLDVNADNLVHPQKVICYLSDGTFSVTKNFSDDTPIWKRYKRKGWAYRYLGIERSGMPDLDRLVEVSDFYRPALDIFTL